MVVVPIAVPQFTATLNEGSISWPPRHNSALTTPRTVYSIANSFLQHLRCRIRSRSWSAVINYSQRLRSARSLSRGLCSACLQIPGSVAGVYTLTMPIDDKLANDAGRSIGFNKYMADVDPIGTRAAASGTEQVIYQGRSVMRIAFSPQGSTTSRISVRSRRARIQPDAARPVGPQVLEVNFSLKGSQLDYHDTRIGCCHGRPW